MADWSVNRFGADNGGADKNALFMKIFSGEVLTTFAQNCVFLPLHYTRTITSGKSASFAVMGTASGSRHTPGTEIVGSSIGGSEKIISIDDLLIAPVSIANIDEAKNHYDVRSKYTNELGIALRNQYDNYVARVAILAARSGANLTGGNGGFADANDAYATTAATLLAGIAKCAQNFDEKNIPDEGRHCVLRPVQWYLLTNDGQAFNRDYGNEGNGSGHAAMIAKWANINIHKSNNIPKTNIVTETGVNNTYTGDFTKTVTPIFHESAVGTVTLMALSTESEYSVSRQATLIVSKIANGTGVLRPEAAAELKTVN